VEGHVRGQGTSLLIPLFFSLTCALIGRACPCIAQDQPGATARIRGPFPRFYARDHAWWRRRGAVQGRITIITITCPALCHSLRSPSSIPSSPCFRLVFLVPQYGLSLSLRIDSITITRTTTHFATIFYHSHGPYISCSLHEYPPRFPPSLPSAKFPILIHHFPPCFSRAHIPAVRYVFFTYFIIFCRLFLVTPFFYPSFLVRLFLPMFIFFSSIIFWAGAVVLHTFCADSPIRYAHQLLFSRSLFVSRCKLEGE
jgi:hypothetical protein